MSEGVNYILEMIRQSAYSLPLDIFIQPIIDLSTLDLLGGEVLVRGIYHGNIIPPALFLWRLEKNEGIITLGDFVIRQSFNFYAQHMAPDKSININLSIKQLAKPDFANKVIAMADRLKINTGKVIFEVTPSEDELIDDCVKENLFLLKKAGFHTAWDDITSLEIMRKCIAIMPFDFLKLKVGKVSEEKISEVKVMIQEAHQKGINVIAEEIETMKQVSLLLKENVEIGQGHLFSRALSKERFKSKYLSSPGR